MRFPLINRESGSACREVAPAVTIEESQKEVILSAEMPGLEKGAVQVQTHGPELTIRGRQQREEVPKGYTVLYQERCPLEYRRTFTLSDDIDREKITAYYEDGVLRLQLAKTERSQPRRIEIN